MLGLTGYILDDTRIDLWDTADYLFTGDDGFVDIVEIKHPHKDFWAKKTGGEYNRYRDFLQPSEELKGTITQATNYIFQVEKKFSDTDWQRKNLCDAPVKPSCLIVIGRSADWSIEENTAYRLLNDSLNGITILTFDQLYTRSERLLKILKKET